MKVYTAKPWIGREEEEAVIEVLRSGILARGKKVEEFEKAFASYIGVSHAISSSNGTTALDVMLKAAGIREGDKVLVPTFTFIATANAVLYQRAKPVFVDSDPETYNVDVEDFKEKAGRDTKAAIVVHLFGKPAPMDEIREICEDYGILLFEDAAQAHGAEYKGKKIGSLSKAAAFSFYATKNMTTGEGGMITTNDKQMAERAALLIDQGQERKYVHTVLGYNFRMTNIAAAIGLSQLRKLDEMNRRRRENAHFLTTKLRGISGIKVPKEEHWEKHVYHQYVIRVVKEEYGESREDLMERLAEKGIFAAIHYPTPIHKQPLYSSILGDIHVENAERLSKEVLSLPVHPLVPKEALETIVEAIKG